MFLDLPSELIHEVVSNLAGNTTALVSCSLTCKGLYLLSHTYLFSQVELHLHTVVTNLEPPYRKEELSREAKLLKVFQEKPEFIPFVHDISIYDLFGGEELLAVDPEPNSGVVQNLSAKNGSPLAVLSKLTSARRVMVFAYNTRSWSHLNPEIQRAIHKAFRFPQVKRIDIHAMSSFPIPLLESCADNLRHVSISTFPTLRLAYPSDLSPSRGTPNTLHLTSLTLSTSTPDLERFADWIPTSRIKLDQLERLVVRTLGDKHKGVQPLVWRPVGECSATIKDLDFFAYLPYGRTVITSPSLMALYDTIDLGCLAALQRLTVRYWLSNLSDTNGQLSLLAHLLRTIQGAGMLEELELHFVIIRTHTPLHPKGSKNWEVLDAVIWEMAPPRLCKITVQFDGIPDQARHEAVGMVGDGLSRIGSRHLLDIQSLCSSRRFIPFSR